jgi:beta-N-acetylhexosaminidase
MSRRRRTPLRYFVLPLIPAGMLLSFAMGFTWEYWRLTDPALTAERLISTLAPGTQIVQATSEANSPPTLTATASPMPTTTATATPLPPTETPTPQFESLLGQMSLEDKIGQMIIAGLKSDNLDEDARLLLTQTRVGGVWFTGRNIQSVEQVREFITTLQSASVQSGPGLPLFVAIDHEGGDVYRFGSLSGVTRFPSNMALGATGHPEWAFAVGQAEAAELRAMGFNLNFAPVLDVNNNPYNPVIHIRSYGADRANVASFGLNYIAGLSQNGVIPVAKHFPGHGNVTVDSHVGLPVVKGSLEELTATELYPFTAAVNSGVPAIMAGHLVVPELDPNRPASLSPQVIDGYLRGTMGFDGVVFTDDVARMQAISASYTVGAAAIKAVQAGVDVIVLNGYQDSAQAVKDSVLWAVANNVISEERIDQSVRRILRLKEQYGLVQGVVPTPGPEPDYAANQVLADRVGLGAITWKPVASDLLPLPPGQQILLVAPEDRLDIVASGELVQTQLGVLLQQRGLTIVEFTYDSTASQQSEALWTNIMAQAPASHRVVVLTWDAALALRASYQWQRDLVATLTAKTPNVIVVAFHTPYDLRALSGVGAYLMTYGNTPSQVLGLADVLAGQQSAKGVLPFPDEALTP